MLPSRFLQLTRKALSINAKVDKRQNGAFGFIYPFEIHCFVSALPPRGNRQLPITNNTVLSHCEIKVCNFHLNECRLRPVG